MLIKLIQNHFKSTSLILCCFLWISEIYHSWRCVKGDLRNPIFNDKIKVYFLSPATQILHLSVVYPEHQKKVILVIFFSLLSFTGYFMLYCNDIDKHSSLKHLLILWYRIFFLLRLGTIDCNLPCLFSCSCPGHCFFHDLHNQCSWDAGPMEATGKEMFLLTISSFLVKKFLLFTGQNVKPH